MGASQSKGSSVSSSSKPETDISPDRSEQTFFAQRSSGSNVQFDENLINHLSSSNPSSTPSSSSVPLSRQEHLDSHIQQRIQSELSRLRAQEQSIRQQIETALEKENLDKEVAQGKEGAGSHSASLIKDLERLEKEAEKVKGGRWVAKDEWKGVEKEREGLLQCFKTNKDTPLNCAEQVQKFKEAVAGIERAFVAAI